MQTILSCLSEPETEHEDIPEETLNGKPVAQTVVEPVSDPITQDEAIYDVGFA